MWRAMRNTHRGTDRISLWSHCSISQSFKKGTSMESPCSRIASSQCMIQQLKRYEASFAKSGTILIDSRLLAEKQSKRLRFTLAHELAHWMIHQDYYKEIDELASKTSSDSDIRTEREADSGAGSTSCPMAE